MVTVVGGSIPTMDQRCRPCVHHMRTSSGPPAAACACRPFASILPVLPVLPAAPVLRSAPVLPTPPRTACITRTADSTCTTRTTWLTLYRLRHPYCQRHVYCLHQPYCLYCLHHPYCPHCAYCLYCPPHTHHRLTLVEARELLGSFDPSLREYAARKLIKRGVQLRKGVVKGVGPTEITLTVR